jgi:tetratricopeptide (TPR) repeat protein
MEGRTTDGLAVDERNANTARVGSAEIASILQNQRLAQAAAGNGEDGSSAEYAGENFAAPTTSSLVMPSEAPGLKVKKARWWPVILLSVVFVAVAAGLLIYYLRHRNSNAGNAPVAETIDQKALVTRQMQDARAFLATGNITAAIDRLHAVINLEPGNTEAHRLLGSALMRNGQRRQAIDEYFVAAQKDAQDVDTLNTLATLQFQEQLYADAVDSYRRLVNALGEGSLTPQDELNYADSLRLAGYTEDSRVEYQKLAATAPAAIANTAKQHLAGSLPPPGRVLPSPPAQPANSPAVKQTSPIIVSQPPPVTNQPAAPPRGPDPDAEYALGVSIVAGRDPRNMPRAELLRALAAAQRGAQGGQHRNEAARLAERLGREFDRRRSAGIQ